MATAVEAATVEAAAKSTTVESAAMEAASMEAAAMEAATESEPDLRAAHIGRAVTAIVGVVVGGKRIADRTSGVRDRGTDTEEHAGRSGSGDGSGCTGKNQGTKSKFCEAFHKGLLC